MRAQHIFGVRGMDSYSVKGGGHVLRFFVLAVFPGDLDPEMNFDGRRTKQPHQSIPVFYRKSSLKQHYEDTE